MSVVKIRLLTWKLWWWKTTDGTRINGLIKAGEATIMKILMESPLRWSDHMKLKPLDKNNMVRGSPKNNAC